MQHYADRVFVERYPLNSKKIWKKMIAGAIALLIFFLVLFIPVGGVLFGSYGLYLIAMGRESEMQGNTALVMNFLYTFALFMAAFFVVLCILNYFYQRAYIKRYYYNVNDKLIIIRKGVFAQQEITVPFERIQDVYVDQDLFDVLFGLYDVHISTATATSGVIAHIDGVEKAAAEEIRKIILSKIQ
jgi:membrane protein YdbS with pleckstrin-like domain